MNEAQHIDHDDIEDSDDTQAAEAYRPEWWGFDPAEEGITALNVCNALDALAPRLAALGDLIRCSSDQTVVLMADDTLLYAGEILRDYAAQTKALATVAGDYAQSQARAHQPTAPDSLALLEAYGERAAVIATLGAATQAAQARKLHADVLAEIEAGSRDEADRDEADRLLADALAALGVAGGEA